MGGEICFLKLEFLIKLVRRSKYYVALRKNSQAWMAKNRQKFIIKN